MTRFRAGSATDVGQVRDANQDSCVVIDDRLFVVADGMGGHNGGEVASQLAIQTFTAAFDEVASAPTVEALVESVQKANDAVIARADDEPDLRGMGTTLVALAPVESDGEPRLAIVNIGDSRCYLLTEDGMRQVTTDHSLVQTLVDNGQISAEEAAHHPQRNILTRAIGIDSRVMADSWELLPFAGDRYVLCSDGLFNEVSEAQIAEVLGAQPNPGEAAATLVRMANEGGGRDNITVVVVDVLDDGGRAEEAAEWRDRVTTTTSGGSRAVAAGSAAAEEEQTRRSDSTTGGLALEDQRLTFRTMLVAGVVAAVVLGLIGVVGFAARSTYFVTFDEADRVTIYQGRPGGFLWFDPTVADTTDLTRAVLIDADLEQRYVRDLEDAKEFGSRTQADEYVDQIRADAGVVEAVTTPVTTLPGAVPTQPSVPTSTSSTTTPDTPEPDVIEDLE